MPTADLNLPNLIGAGNHQIAGAIWQLCEKMNYLLNHLDDANIASGGLSSTSIRDFQGQSVKVLKAEIAKLQAGAIEAQYLKAAVGDIAMARIRHAKIDVAQVDRLEAAVVEAVLADIEKINAGTVETTEMFAELVKAISAEIGKLDVSTLYASLAEVVHLAAKTADIDFAKIKDLVAGTAIITQGVGGELYINRLKVTEANMVSLTVGELIVKGLDGQFYRMTIDEDGNAVTEPVQVEGGNIADGTLGGGKLIENAISVRELNAAQIFADEAVLVKLFAGMGKFGELFAQSAVMPYIKASVIESEALSIRVSETVKGAVEGETGAIRDEVGVLKTILTVSPTNGVQIRQPQSDNGIDINNGAVAIVDESGKQVAVMAQGQSVLPVLSVTGRMRMGHYVTSALPDGGVIEQWMEEGI